MNIALRRDLTVPEYLAWAGAQGEWPRTQLIDGQICQMPPERAAHNRLKFCAANALAAALAAASIQGEVMIDGMSVPINATSAYEPDVLLYLGSPIGADDLLVPHPIVVIEILSPTTAHLDKGVKLAGYFSIASVQHYLLIDPDTMRLTHHHRAADSSIAAEVHATGSLRLDPPGLVLDLDTVFKT